MHSCVSPVSCKRIVLNDENYIRYLDSSIFWGSPPTEAEKEQSVAGIADTPAEKY